MIVFNLKCFVKWIDFSDLIIFLHRFFLYATKIHLILECANGMQWKVKVYNITLLTPTGIFRSFQLHIYRYLATFLCETEGIRDCQRTIILIYWQLFNWFMITVCAQRLKNFILIWWKLSNSRWNQVFIIAVPFHPLVIWMTTKSLTTF